MPQLIVVEGPNMGDCFELESYQTIGSETGNTIKLKDRRISGKQLKILGDGESVSIFNLDPSKVLMVNGEVMIHGVLRHGDMISLCNTMMLYSDDDAEEKNNFEDELSLEHSQIYARKPLELEDSQLFTNEEDFSAKLYSLYQIGGAILEHEDKEELCLRVLKIIYQEFKFQRGVILLYDEDLNRLKQKAALKAGRKITERVQCSQTIIDLVLKNEEAILSKNALKDDRFISKQSIAEFHIVSCMCVPIIFQANILGVVYIDSSDLNNAYTSADLDQLTKIGMQVALALENINCQLVLKESTRILKSLSKASQWLSTNLDKSSIIKEASSFALSILRSQRVSFLTLEDGSEVARIAFSIGIKKSVWDEVEVKLGDRLVGKAIESNLPILFPFPTPNPLLEGWVQSEKNYRTNSFLIVPVSIEDSSTGSITRVGAICVTDKLNGADFNQSDLEHLQILASQTGISFKNAELYEKATVDALTKLYVRQYFFTKLEELLETEKKFALLLLDLDHFKSVNDTYGHPTGDEILREAGALLKEMTGKSGYPCRYGGEEFAILLPLFELESAKETAYQVNEAFRVFTFNSRLKPEINCTISIGISIRQTEDNSESLIARADKALYVTKDAGRDHFSVLPEDEG